MDRVLKDPSRQGNRKLAFDGNADEGRVKEGREGRD
jgi:hypothetical protein